MPVRPFFAALATPLLLGTTMLATPRAEAHSVTYDLHIPAQDLTRALQELALASQHKLFYRSELVEGKTSHELKGQFTAEQAVQQLLSGTGLTFDITPGSAVVLIKDKSESPASHVQKTSGLLSRLRLAQADQPPSSAPAVAATSAEVADDAKLDVIVVSAQKKDERLQDVPAPVAVIDTSALTENGQSQLQDYYSKVPGVALAIDGSGGRPMVTVRGITTGDLSSPTVGVVIDDVPYGYTIAPSVSPTAPDIDPGDLERVEVLRGPQGTLYGASSLGGLLKFVTIDPSTAGFSARVQGGLEGASQSSDLGHSLRGSVNVALGDTLAVRASAFTLSTPGYVDNITNGARDINRRDSDGGRVSLLWHPSDVFSLKLNAMLQQSDRDGTADVDPTKAPELQQESLPGSGIYDRHSQAYSAIAQAKLGTLALTSITGYTVDDMNFVSDLSGLTPLFGGLVQTLFGGVTGLSLPETQRTDKITQEIRASIPLGTRVDWLFGLFYSHESFDDDWAVYAADYDTGEVAGQAVSVHTPTRYTEYAAFTDLTFDITDRFDIQLGGRFSKNKVTLSNTSTGVFDFLSPASVERRSEDSSFTYLVTPRFKFSPDLMAYARLASGYRPGGPNIGCGNPGIPCSFGPDRTQNYEIGVKGDAFEHALSFDASVYYIDWRDIQIPLTPPTIGVSYQDNAARAKSQGVELSVEALPMRGMRLAAWVAYNDAKLSEDLPAFSNSFGRSGDRLPYSSPFSGSVSIDQRFPAGAELTGVAGASFSYVDNRKDVFGPPNARRTFPSYTQLDLHAGLNYQSWSMNVFVNNVADERGVLKGGVDPLGIPSSKLTYIQPRTVGMTLSKTF